MFVAVTDDGEKMDLAWNVITKKIDTRCNRPSDTERQNTEYNENNYLGKVISPWYQETGRVSFLK